MTEIVGIYRFDGQPVDGELLQTMARAARPAGPVTCWCEGEIGLGVYGVGPHAAVASAMIATTVSGSKVIADARIDNRVEVAARLAGTLHGTPGEAASASDLDLIGASYERWGEQCPAQLVGDYAFVVWDAQQRTLFCARDHFGVRPFFYYAGLALFVFASTLAALLACPLVPRRVNARRVGLHLAAMVAENRMTFYQEIMRLEPAHSLRVRRGQAAAPQRYWRLDGLEPLHLASDEAYAEAFRACLTEAVRCRLPAAPQVATLFSGGLDSTAVMCLARDLIQQGAYGGALHTVSAVFEQTPACDERPFIQAALDQGGVVPHFVAVEASSPLAQIDTMMAATGEPFTAPTLYILWALYAEVRRQGIDVLLDGVDGDTAVHHGDAYLAELARRGEWAAFFQLAQAIGRRTGHARVDLLMRRYGEPYLNGLARRGRWLKLYRELGQLAPYATVSRQRLFWHQVQQRMARAWPWLGASPGTSVATQDGFGATGLAGARLRQATALDGYVAAAQEESGKPIETARQEHYQLLNAPLLPHLFELSTVAARNFGLDVRHPFADRRLIEFCYRLPPQQKMVDGWTRYIVRRSLDGILPPAIQWRGGKTENSAAVTKAFLSQDAACLDKILGQQSDRLADYVDMDGLRRAVDRYRRTGSRKDEMLVWQAATLAVWLAQMDARKDVLPHGFTR